jgi:hypothetical protein
MANRYSNTPISLDENRKRRYGTWIISIPPYNSSDLYIQVTSADRLDILASKLYGDQSLWYIIAAANGLGKGSLVVPPNTVLRIPSTEQTISFINSINTRR